MNTPSPPAVLHAGFRPLFLLAGLAASIVMLRIGLVLAGVVPPPAGNPFTWHGHEMLFGYVAAAIAGFLLTAVPNWTGTRPVGGAPLLVPVGLWLVARAALWDGNAAWWGMVADMAFLPAVLVLVTRPLLHKGSPRLWLPIVAVSVIALANVAWHVMQVLGQPMIAGRVLAFTTMLIALLIAIIGGRVTPAFTRNRLQAAGESRLPREPDVIDGLAIGASALIAIAELGAPAVAAMLALPVAALHAIRLSGWRGHRVLADPLLLMLHVGYGWLVVGYAVRAGVLLDPSPGQTWALHGLLVGAIGTMTLAMMSRATLGHTGRALRAGQVLTLAFLLLQGAAIVRLAAPWTGPGAWGVAGTLWLAAFTLFLVRCGPMLVRPRVDTTIEGWWQDGKRRT